MDWIIALGHIIGSFIAAVALGLAIAAVSVWWNERADKQVLQEFSLALGVSIDALRTEEMAPRLTRLSAERYSAELLRNRLSDLCGYIRTAWDWLGLIVQVTVLAGVLWYSFSESRETAVYAWTIIPIMLFFWIASSALSIVCKLLTGRYPGQARRARASLAEYLAAKKGA